MVQQTDRQDQLTAKRRADDEVTGEENSVIDRDRIWSYIRGSSRGRMVKGSIAIIHSHFEQVTDGQPTDRPIDGRTDMVSSRVVCLRLKKVGNSGLMSATATHICNK